MATAQPRRFIFVHNSCAILLMVGAAAQQNQPPESSSPEIPSAAASQEVALDIGNFYNQLLYTTVKIEAWDSTRPSDNSVGTGFFLQFPIDATQKLILLVTNRHVARKIDDKHKLVKDFDIGRIVVHLQDPTTGKPQQESFPLELLKWGEGWRDHPNPEIDLCATNAVSILEAARKMGKEPFIRSVDPSLIPTSEVLAELQAVEHVVMVGYPRALCDDYHNFPIIRSGTSASHPGLNFQGLPQIAIDMTVLPGSSGSPVFLVQDYGHYRKDGQYEMGTFRRFFLGVVYATASFNELEAIVAVPAPTANIPALKMTSFLNLGYVIRSKEVLAFESVFTPPKK